jgi:hypothetical protein
MVCLSSFICSFPSVSFSGSRVLGSSASSSCRAFLPVFGSFSGSVAVGCASGVDSLVRQYFPFAQVFRVVPPVSRASFALRSARLVQSCHSSGGLLIAFPLGACPSGVAVSSTFGGCGSGTWGSIALAIGLGCSVLVVLPVGSSSSSFSVLASHFQFVGVAPCGGSLWLSVSTPLPIRQAGVQLSLF